MLRIPLLALAVCLGIASPAQETQLTPFPLSSVRLLDGPFKNAEQVDLEYILSLDPDRLLAPFLKEAGVEPKKEVYGNWEADGLGGHTAGHVLSALAMMYASNGSEKALERLQYMLAELKLCQDQRDDGYLGGVPDGPAMWAEIEAGKIDAGGFSLNGKWVPWYNLHKLYAGLRDAWHYAGQEVARDMLIRLSDWAIDLCADLNDEQMQDMLRAEHGGMNEVLADVFAITGEEKYLDLARRFSHRAILDPLLAGRDELTGLHANTQIPKVIGFFTLGGLDGRPEWQNAARFFWQTVTRNRSIAFGGNSVREHFNPPDDFSRMLEEEQGPETCNTYNMLRLSMLLYLKSADPDYIDFYERGLYNHILSSQHPEHGGFVYFTPIRPRHYRVYSQPQQCFWCCVGSGMENHAKYGELIYAQDGDDLYVNLFIPSRLDWKEKGLVLRQQTRFPDDAFTEMTLESTGPDPMTIKVRKPYWLAEGEMTLEINGEPAGDTRSENGFMAVTRRWKAGDKLKVSLPMQLHLEQLPDGEPYYAAMYGPVVLAAKTSADDLDGIIADDARMGHIAAGEPYPIAEAPLLLGKGTEVLDGIEKRPGGNLTFSLEEVVYPASYSDLELIPFFRLHDARYMMYWRLATPDDLKAIQSEIAAADRERMDLQAVTIDYVAPGEQQSESDHYFQGEGTESGLNGERHWRHAHDWFSYRLNDPDKEAAALRITYFGLDEGRNFDILLNGKPLASVALQGGKGPEFFTIDYPIPDNFVEAAGQESHTLLFRAHPNSIAGGIYGVRLLRMSEKN